MAKLVEKTYGEALFELAVSENKIDVLLSEATGLITVFDENEELLKLLNHPKITKDEKVQVMEDIFKNNVSDDMVGFLTLIVKKDRNNDMLDILNYFVSKVKEYKKIGIAHITTAVDMSDSQKKAVEDKLISTTNYQSFEMNYSVDSSLIGGMIIRVGDRVIDSTIKSKINELSKSLNNIQLSQK